MLLPCSFVRLKKLFQVKNGLSTSFLFFFFENGSVGLNGDEKEDGLNVVQKKKINKKSDDSVKPFFP